MPLFRCSFPREALFHNQSLVVQPTMAPNLASSKHGLIYDMIHSSQLSITEMAQAAGCNKSTVSRISSNISMFGSVKAPNGSADWRTVDRKGTKYISKAFSSLPYTYTDITRYVFRIDISSHPKHRTGHFVFSCVQVLPSPYDGQRATTVLALVCRVLLSAISTTRRYANTAGSVSFVSDVQHLPRTWASCPTGRRDRI
jgi:hypothetical protein